MLLHYLKVAFRNHSKHKVQSIISLLSLATAFACLSLATYWMHYEQSYDSFVPNYENIYMVSQKSPTDTRVKHHTISKLPFYLMENYGEIDKACGMRLEWSDDRLIEIENQVIQAKCRNMTQEALEIFDIRLLKGNRNLDSWKEDEVAISEQLAQQVCGKNSPIGLKMLLKKKNGMDIEKEYNIVAVFKTRPQHSNFKFHILKVMKKESEIQTSVFPQFITTFILLNHQADPIKFLQKLSADTIIGSLGSTNVYNVLTPLQELHYTYPKEKQNIHLNDVKLFVSAAVLLSVCALINYLTLFVSRLRNRGRDMALRTICGASNWQICILLMVEYLFLLLGSLFFSMIFIELCYNSFVQLSQLEIDRSTVYAGCGYLLLFILTFSVMLSLFPILYFKNKTLRVQIEAVPGQLSRNHFRIAGVCVQLFISLLFIFCSIVMLKQIHYLIYDDINIERKNIATITSHIKDEQIMDILRQIPLVTEMVPTYLPLFPTQGLSLDEIKGFEGKEDCVIPAYTCDINQDIAQFYGIKIKEGTESFELQRNEFLINETLAKQLNDPNPIGKELSFFLQKGIIKGIVYDFHYQPPTEPVQALYFRKCLNMSELVNRTVAFKYKGDFTVCKTTIEKAFEGIEPNIISGKKYELLDGETVYNSYLTSEFNLLKLLNIITIISLLIALFGVYALIHQECECQRKNIAIRKVYGAQVRDILMMFFKKYMLQVVLATTLAFPIGYVLMKHWLENYSRQTDIGFEIFLSIFIGMVLLVLLCIGWHVWRAANENPATIVKKE